MIKRIKVQSYTHSVRKVKDFGEETGYFAAFDPINQEFLYDASVKDCELGNHLMHEVMESINWQNDLKLPHSKLSTISTAICSVLRDNPEFVRLFLEKQ
jgi:hypothetical protein